MVIVSIKSVVYKFQRKLRYITAELNGQKVFDEFIDTNNWYKQDLTCCIYGDIILMLGNSLGALGELVYAYYLYKLFIGDKPEVKTIREKNSQRS